MKLKPYSKIKPYNKNKFKSLTPQEKKFCEEYIANGAIAPEAFQKAYPKATTNTHGNLTRMSARILVRPSVALYISEKRKELAQKYSIERDTITEELLYNINYCRINNLVDNHRRAVMDLARLHGLIIDRHDVTQNHSIQVMNNVVIDGKDLNFNIGDGSATETTEILEDDSVERVIE